jgi:hypothetical protein
VKIPARSDTATFAEALLEMSATLVAVTVCVPGADGGVYRPLEEIVPMEADPPGIISTDQVVNAD